LRLWGQVKALTCSCPQIPNKHTDSPLFLRNSKKYSPLTMYQEHNGQRPLRPPPTSVEYLPLAALSYYVVMCDECEYSQPKFDHTDGNYTDWVVAVRSRLSVALIGRDASIVVVICRLSVCTECIITKRCIPQPKFVLTACSRTYMRHVAKSEGYKSVSRSSQTLRYI